MKVVFGNILDMAFSGELDVVVQGCNCFCRMGRGLAKEIAERTPEAVEADNMTERGARSKLGTFSSATVLGKNGHIFTVVNAYTQYHWNEPEGEVLVDYTAVRQAMRAIRDAYANNTIGIPLIGAGLARGEWARIERIILEELSDCDVTIVHFEEDFPALFKGLIEKTKHSSNSGDVLNTHEGKRLIEAGGATIRYMFQNNVPLTAHTMVLLFTITGDNPISPEDVGYIQKMSASWKKWARWHEYY